MADIGLPEDDLGYPFFFLTLASKRQIAVIVALAGLDAVSDELKQHFNKLAAWEWAGGRLLDNRSGPTIVLRMKLTSQGAKANSLVWEI